MRGGGLDASYLRKSRRQNMNRTALCLVFVCVFALPALAQQNEQTKFIADTLVVQANGTYEAEPDLATLTFDISSQDKDLTQAYTKATQAMQQIVAVAEKNGLTKQEISKVSVARSG